MTSLNAASHKPHEREPADGLLTTRELLIYFIAFLIATMAAIACGVHIWTDDSAVGLLSTGAASATAWSIAFINVVRSMDRLVTKS